MTRGVLSLGSRNVKSYPRSVIIDTESDANENLDRMNEPSNPLKNLENLSFGWSFSKTTRTESPVLDFAQIEEASAINCTARASQRLIVPESCEV